VDANGFAHEQVAQIQRARILSAMFDVACERGAANVSVADVVARSGVSRRTFYESFSGREDCFLAAFEDALALASERVLPAYRARRKWRERIRAALIALLSFLDEQPVIGRLLIVESLSGGAQTLGYRDQVLAQVAQAIDEGRALKGAAHHEGKSGAKSASNAHHGGQAGVRSASNASGPPELTAEGLVGGVLSVLHARLAHPRGDQVSRLAHPERQPLLDLVNQLMGMIVLPYLGPAAARRELTQPVERAPIAHSGTDQPPVAGPLVDPFKDAGMRLTYRTVRVLLAVAELGGRGSSPSGGLGPSNRVIGRRAGMTDQGQISKLLARLKRLGLIENTRLAPVQGAPNEWALTESGRRLVESIAAHTGIADRAGRPERHAPGTQGPRDPQAPTPRTTSKEKERP
jgi:AcrR family transcriptional regulator